ncbi:hypothetical protein CCMSSC00406_0002356 [Pleurotus cornucopiae]|uniref:Uncharacterized protein n=1 Tax=Pleurotus cornucopiae TaxID=5321 RepID=A0ACB7J3R8_PLECO|nr:hypothetical protein CCMSSC00406_0002356 [Pleurotus cornucopiae]
MATAIYTHQPPANYSFYHALAPHQSQYASSHLTSSPSSKKMHKESREASQQRELRERGYRLCDQCGAVENPAVARFRLCGGCMTTQYCSQDCQKAHWASHKAICQHTVSQQTSPSHHHSSAHPSQYSSSSYGGGYDNAHESGYGSEGYEETVKALRKYTSTHTALLGWAGFQALRLKKVPANIRHSVLVINLTQSSSHSNSHSSSTHNSHHHHQHNSTSYPSGRSDKNKRGGSKFAFHSTQILPLSSYLTDPLILADIARRSNRSRASGGVGCLIVVLRVLPPNVSGGIGMGMGVNGGVGMGGEGGGEINQVVPVEVDRVEGIQWAERADWEGVLREGLESGREFRV